MFDFYVIGEIILFKRNEDIFPIYSIIDNEVPISIHQKYNNKYTLISTDSTI